MSKTMIALGAFAFLTGASASYASPVENVFMIEKLVGNTGSFIPKNAQQPGACDMSARSACTNSSDSYTFNGCTVADGKVTLLGGWDEVFSGTSAETCAAPLVDGESVRVTSQGLTATVATGESMIVDTAAGTAYDGTAIPATGAMSSLAGDVTTTSVDGAHAIFKDKDGNLARECYAMTTTPVQMTGKKDDGSFAISEGALRIFHQVEKYTSDVTIENVAWSDKACCHAVSGQLTEVMSGAKTGTRSLSFTATCGIATLVEVDGTTSDITLPACN